MPSFDAIVIGAGHNGLVCAAMLARKRRKVLVLEAGDEPGGAARTVEFVPGHSVSHVAHVLSHLHPAVADTLMLERHGLRFAATEIPTVVLNADANHLILHGAFGERIEGDIGGADAAAWDALRTKLLAYSAVLQPWLARTPPRLGTGNTRDMLALGSLGLAIRRLGTEDMREFLRMILMNIADVLDDEIADPRLKGAIAFDAVLGSSLGPRSPNSLMSLYYRLAGETTGRQAALALPHGGMGAVVDAMVSALTGWGGQIRTGAVVERILVEDGRAVGVALAGGEEIRARVVVSGANPRTTFLELLGHRHLDTGFARRVSQIRMRGNAAKFHLALTGLPEFTGLDESHLGGRLVIAPTVDHVEWAFNPSKYGRFSDSPVMEITIPTVTDPSMAPAGNHVLSAVVQYAPSDLGGGWSFSRTDFQEIVMETISAYAPGIGRQTIAAELLTPADLESRYRMPGGHWHHGDLGIDRMFMLRPLPGAAQYTTPVLGLYLCGAGSHPGGGVMGAAGYNAAGRILKLER
jgi:phytoene dehydrogenase-like protein